MNTFGARLRDARKARGMSQDEMAGLGGVARRAQVRYESDERTPDAGYLMAIQAAGFDIIQLLTGSDATFESRLAQLRHASGILQRLGVPEIQASAMLEALYGALEPAGLQSERQLLRDFRACDAGEQETILRMVAALAANHQSKTDPNIRRNRT